MDMRKIYLDQCHVSRYISDWMLCQECHGPVCLQALTLTAQDLVGGVQRCRIYDADQLVAACIALAAEIPPQVRCIA
jgi:hypothetical protein